MEKTLNDFWLRDLEKEWQNRDQLKQQEIVKLFMPDSLQIIRQNLLKINIQIKQEEQELKKWLKKRQELVKQKAEWFLEVVKNQVKEEITKLKRKKNHCIRDIYFALKKGDEINLGNNFLDKIRIAEEMPILEIISQRIKVDKIGIDRYRCKCFLHTDKTPSLTIYENTNSFYCFSCCQGGTGIDFVMKFYQVDFKEAIKLLTN